jgi:hypothetical protein
MVRGKLILLVMLAAMLAVGPAFHNHSLIPAAGQDLSHATNFCAACVGATARITSPAPAIAVPVVVTIALAAPPAVVVSADARGPVPSRAPPTC